MAQRSAIIFLPDDTQKTGDPRPLMLQNILGTPLLRWLTEALQQQGVTRFFLAAAGKFCDEAARCFPKEASLTLARDVDPADLLHVFLSTADEAEEDLLAVTGPAVYAPALASRNPGRAPVAAPACMASRLGLMEALDDAASIGRYLQRQADACTDRDGFFAVTSAEELPRWGHTLGQLRLAELRSRGVEIWDYQSCYVAPGVSVGIGTVLLPGTILEGDTTVGYGCRIGPNTRLIDTEVGNHATVEQSRAEGARIGNHATVGPFANLRPGTALEQRVKAGAFVELKNAKLGEDAQVPHLSYLGDAEVGARANVGCGTVTANFDRAAKHETKIEAEAFLGCNSTLVAPVTVGQGAYIGAGSVVTEDVPAQALGISRPKQLNRREWSLRHKRPE